MRNPAELFWKSTGDSACMRRNVRSPVPLGINTPASPRALIALWRHDQTIFATTAQRTDARTVRARPSTSRRYIPAGEHAIIPRSPMSDRQISPRMSAAHSYHCDARPPKHRRVYGLINTRLLQSHVIRKQCRLSPLESAHRLLVDRCNAVAAVIPCIRVSTYPTAVVV